MKREISIVGMAAILFSGCGKGNPTAPDLPPAKVIEIVNKLALCQHFAAIQTQTPKISVKQDDSGRVIAVEVEIWGSNGWEHYAVTGGASPVQIDAIWNRLFRIRTASDTCKSDWAELPIGDANPGGPAEPEPLPPVVVPPVDPCAKLNKTWGGHHPPVDPCKPHHHG